MCGSCFCHNFTSVPIFSVLTLGIGRATEKKKLNLKPMTKLKLDRKLYQQ